MPETMPTVIELARLCEHLSGSETATDDAERIDLLTALETVKSACAAAQARLTVSFDASQRREQSAKGGPRREAGQGHRQPFLPAEQGIAVHTALTRHADTLRARGDTRSRGQIMADTLVERVTGQSRAPAIPTEVQLVMTGGALLGQDPAPPRLVGYGPLPAAVARAILRASTDATDEAQV